VQAAVDQQNPVIVYTVRSLTNFSTDGEGGGVFSHAMIVRPGTTVRDVAQSAAPTLVEYLQVGKGTSVGLSSKRWDV
jgi:hypothetical protein